MAKYRLWLAEGFGGKRENWGGITVDFAKEPKSGTWTDNIIHIPDDFPNGKKIASVLTDKMWTRWTISDDGVIEISHEFEDFAWLVPDEPKTLRGKYAAFNEEQYAITRATECLSQQIAIMRTEGADSLMIREIISAMDDITVWQKDLRERLDAFERQLDKLAAIFG